jgi:hypothetical protein
MPGIGNERRGQFLQLETRRRRQQAEFGEEGALPVGADIDRDLCGTDVGRIFAKISGTVSQRRCAWSSWMVKRPMLMGLVAS